MKILEDEMIHGREMEPCGGYSYFALNKIIKDKKNINPSFIKLFLTAKSFDYNILEFYCLGCKRIAYQYDYKQQLKHHMVECLRREKLESFENIKLLEQILTTFDSSEFNYAAVGETIKFLRIKDGKSQGQIIAKLSTGVYQRNIISKIENMNKFKSSVPKVDRLMKILKIVHSSFEVFLFYYLKFSCYGTNSKEQSMFDNYEKNRIHYLQVADFKEA